MSPFEITVFVICILIFSFIAGGMDATKGLPFRKMLLCWGAYLLLATVPTFFFLQVWPEGESSVSLYNSSDEENSLVGPSAALVLLASSVAALWFGRLLGNVLKKRIFGTDPK